MIDTLLPWQTSLWEKINRQYTLNRLPNALLLTGAKGVGKKQFAELFAKQLLCESQNLICNQCRSCHFMNNQTHPDFFSLEPKIKNSPIKIDQIRTLAEKLTQTSRNKGYQVVLLNPAEAMNTSASNALLKVLEEPPGRVIFMLITHNPFKLSETIRSRCQSLAFPTPPLDVTKKWLQTQLSEVETPLTSPDTPSATPPPSSVILAKTGIQSKTKSFACNTNNINLCLSISGGSPLKALALIADPEKLTQRQAFIETLVQLMNKTTYPTKAVELHIKNNLSFLLTTLLNIVIDIIYLKVNTKQVPSSVIPAKAEIQREMEHFVRNIINQDKASELKMLAQKISFKKLIYYQHLLRSTIKTLHHHSNLNTQLLLENLLIQWSKLGKTYAR